MASWRCLARRWPMKIMPCAPATRRWRMQDAMTPLWRRGAAPHGVPVHIRVGLNSGEVVVRAIGSDLHMDYTAVGQTTHLAARMEQMATPGSVLTDGRDPAAGRRVRPGQRAGPRRRSRGWRTLWRCLSSSAPAPPGRACRRLRPVGSPVSSGGRRSSRPCARPWSGPAPAMARSWRSLASPGWASPAWSTSSPAPITRRAGSCSRAARSPMARPPRTSPSATCSSLLPDRGPR